MTTTDTREYGLLPLPVDERDFSHETVFGSVALDELPKEDFFVSHPLEIKNQDLNYNSDFCPAYAVAEVSEDQEGVAFVPEYTFAKGKQLQARARQAASDDQILEVVNAYGLDLRTICKAACQFGFLERELDPFHCNTEDRPGRDYLADWRNWPKDLDMLAWDHAKASFFAVDGPYDTFDNICSVMYKNRSESRSILTGARWRPSWDTAEGGFVDLDTYDVTERGSAHAFKVFGWMKAKDKIWLVAQLSGGPGLGDKGLFYFSREVVNREFVFGAFTFKDMAKSKAQYHNDLQIPVSASLWQKAWRVFVYWLGFNKK